MSSQLTVEQLASRLNNFPYDRYLYIGGFMRSVAWAAGTIVLLQLIRQPEKYLPRLLPWLVSFLATMVTLMTWGRGVLFTNSRASLGDSIIPTLMGILEFCLFAVLAPDGTFGIIGSNKHEKPKWREKLPHFHAWYLWFFLLAIHTGLAVLLVRNRIANTKIYEDYDPKLCSIAKQYMQWMVADRDGAGEATIASLVLGIVMIGIIKWWLALTEKRRKSGIHTKARKRINALLVVLSLLYVGLFAMPVYKLYGVITVAEQQRQIADDEITKIKRESNPLPSRCTE